MANSSLRLAAIGAASCVVGAISGMFGVGGGILLVPILALGFHYDQHIAQGTSLVALVPPSGALAFLQYYHAHEVNVVAGLLIMPGVFFGGLIGSRAAQRLSPLRLRRIFAAVAFILGVCQAFSALRH